MKTYQGFRDPDERDAAGECTVKVDGKELTPAASLKLRNHSPTGFSWGYGGSGPAQLALAIMLDHFGDAEKALRYYMDFKWKTVARWDQSADWSITTEQIDAIVTQIEEERRFVIRDERALYAAGAGMFVPNPHHAAQYEDLSMAENDAARYFPGATVTSMRTALVEWRVQHPETLSETT